MTTPQDESNPAHSLRREAGADALVGDFLRGVPSIGLPAKLHAVAVHPGASARVQTRLDATTTLAKITKPRRGKSLNFTGAVHAAIVPVAVRSPSTRS